MDKWIADFSGNDTSAANTYIIAAGNKTDAFKRAVSQFAHELGMEEGDVKPYISIAPYFPALDGKRGTANTAGQGKE